MKCILRIEVASLCALASTLVLTPVGPAFAEEEAGVVEEVIVTATYRETNLMDTPQSINAVTGELIENLGAQSMEDIFTMVPGLNMVGDRDGENRYAVRGVTSQSGATGYYLVGASVGVYLDGTPVTAALGPDAQVSGNLFDIERIEVLKGPQGTLFGEGSQGGTIRYLYKQPDLTQFDAAVNASLSNMAESGDNSNRLDAMVNIPLGDSAALRLAGWRSERAGFIDNQEPDEKDYNKGEATGGRAVLKYETDRFSLTGSIYHNVQETEGGSATVRAFDAVSPRMPGLFPRSADEIDIYSFIVETDFGWANFQSLTSFTDRSINAIYEFSLASRDGLDFFYGGGAEGADHPRCQTQTLCQIGYAGFFNLGDPNATIGDGNNLLAFDGFIDSFSERWVQEFRLVSPADQRLRWTAGLFWKDSKDHSQSKQAGLYFPGRYESFGVRFEELLAVPANTHTDTLEEFAVFGELSFDITDTVEVTVGLRVSDLTQEFSNTDSGTDDRPVSPKVVVSWRPTDDLMVYVNYATGFRPGNVNNHMEFNARQYDVLIPERAALGLDTTELEEGQLLARERRFFDGDEVSSYELGIKATLFNGRAQIMASAYFLDWEDMIIVERDPLLGDQGNQLNFYNTNSGGAEIQGIELEVNAFVTDRLSVRISGDFNDTEVTQAPLFSTSSPDGAELIYAPNWSASFAVDYAYPLPNGWELSVHADQAYVAEQFTDTANSTTTPAYHKTNARITVRSADRKWRIALYGNNVTNEEILRNFSGGSFYWHSPRQIGLEVGYQL